MVKNIDPLNSSQNVKIEYLESQIQAFKTRTSVLQQQRISAIDALDEVAKQLRHELEEESRNRRCVEQNLRQNSILLHQVEKERDDLREAVLDLIKEVEKNNDFKSWPHSKMQLSSYADPAAFALVPPQSTQLQELQENLVYANSIVRTLKAELFLERQSHAQTRARVYTLEAQVASRDTALEAWAQQTGSSTPSAARSSSMNTKGKGKRKSDAPRDLDQAEISSLFVHTLVHNRYLEQEIRNLFANLERARSRAATQVSHPPRPSTPSPPVILLKPEIPQHSPSPQRGRTRERKTPYHESPERRTTSTDILIPEFEADLPHCSMPLRPSSSPKITTAGLVDDFDHHVSGQAGPSRRPQTPQSPASTVRPNDILQRLDDQIHLLSAQIDAFREERATLLRLIDSQLHVRNENDVEELVDEGERSLEPDGHSFEELEAELHGLRLDEVHLDDEETDLRRLRRELELDESTDGGERSMDLETPLISTFVMLPGAEIPLGSTSRSRSRSRSRAGSTDPGTGDPRGVDHLLDGQVADVDVDGHLIIQHLDDDEILMIRPRVGGTPTLPL